MESACRVENLCHTLIVSKSAINKGDLCVRSHLCNRKIYSVRKKMCTKLRFEVHAKSSAHPVPLNPNLISTRLWESINHITVTEAEREYAMTGKLHDAKEALQTLRRKHFGQPN